MGDGDLENLVDMVVVQVRGGENQNAKNLNENGTNMMAEWTSLRMETPDWNLELQM